MIAKHLEDNIATARAELDAHQEFDAASKQQQLDNWQQELATKDNFDFHKQYQQLVHLAYECFGDDKQYEFLCNKERTMIDLFYDSIKLLTSRRTVSADRLNYYVDYKLHFPALWHDCIARPEYSNEYIKREDVLHLMQSSWKYAKIVIDDTDFDVNDWAAAFPEEKE